MTDKLRADHDQLIKTGNEWYESYNNKRIECDALRQAWEGSKQIIKMIEAERDAYQVAADKLAGEIKDMQRQEPVRWMKETADGFSRYYEADETQPPGCTPLYAAPQPVQPTAMPFVPWSKEAEMLESWVAQPVAQPLTDDQIEVAYRELYRNEAFGQTTYEMVEAGIRYAEKHHGIGAKESQPNHIEQHLDMVKMSSDEALLRQALEAFKRLENLHGWKPYIPEDENDTWVSGEQQALNAMQVIRARLEGVAGGTP